MKPLVMLNWKMAPARRAEALKLIAEVNRQMKGVRKIRTVVCPPFPYLADARAKLRGADLGSQDISQETLPPHTGEVSAAMLRDMGVRYVLVGHSERRARGEGSEVVRKKLANALERALLPVVCIGENTRSSEGDYLAVLAEQIQGALRGFAEGEAKKVLFAYEPLWAIGKNARGAMQAEELHQTILFIRKIFAEKYSRELATGLPVLYGGSVKAENAHRLLAEGRANGLLVGSASVDSAALRELLTVLAR